MIVRGPSRTGFDEELFAQLARTPGVETASPVLELDVALAGDAARCACSASIRSAPA